MKVNSIREYSINRANRNQVSFQATPAQILEALPAARLCPGKKGALHALADFFASLQKQLAEKTQGPVEYSYKLGKTNEMPPDLKTLDVNGLTLERLDRDLNADPFKCSPSSTCGCGGSKSKGSFFADLLKMIGVENPDSIEIAVNKK